MSAPAAVHLRAEEICDFLIAQGLSSPPGSGNRDLPLAVPMVIGDQLPKAPNRIYAVTPTGGPGFISERGEDVQSFQIRTRGKAVVGGMLAAASVDAENFAWAVDGMLMSLTAGMIGARWVRCVDRVGSPPTLLMRDSANRVHLTGNYLFYVARSD